MKKIKYFAAIAAAVLLSTSCKNILEEQPRTFFEPGFFSTQAGVEGGLTALYASLRYAYGQAYYYNINTTGTDEATWGQSADGNFKDADLSGVGDLNPSTSRSDVLWGMAFTYINTASGIIENAEAVGLDKSLIAEAKFFRAWYYFQLVQTFGGVPLDLGSGKLKFNSTPSRVSVRNTVPEVYEAIFSDLKAAETDLPDQPRLTGTLTKNVARLVLAKAYLTYGWWIENPKQIATYPAADRTGSAAEYYNLALSKAEEGINNPGVYGLCETFYEVNVASNDRNKEIMLYADHTEKSEQYNGGSLSYGGGGAPDNFAGWMMNWNHGTIKVDGIQVIQREACQDVGRPWTRMAPTHEAIKTFTSQDITVDSRFEGTFTTAYYGNWQKGGITAESVTGADGSAIPQGGLVFKYVPTVIENIDYSAGLANIGAGKVPGHSEYILDLNGISRIAYPANWKLQGHRTDYDAEKALGSPNAGSTRPYPVLKYSDFYLTAAEAALKAGKNAEAVKYVNVIRARAGKWKYIHSTKETVDYDYSVFMTNATPTAAEITIDFILDERMREYYAEGFRWFDLVRTQTWKDRAGKYTISGNTWGSHTPAVYNRTIEDYMYLRPIPQGQLDGMEMTKEEKAAYQNPGYPTE